MNTLAKLDRSSKLLTLLSLLGIIFSLLGFFILAKRGASSLTGQEVIAKLSYYSNDARVKRSSDIHWSSVSGRTDCYDQDRIFTGPESQATLQLEQGAEIKLFPNSLIYITKNMVELESGTIEVDNSRGVPVQLKSFGEKFKVDRNSKIRIIKDKTTRKIIPLNETSRQMPIISTLNKEIELTEVKGPSYLPAPKLQNIDQKIDSDSVTLQWDGPSDAQYELEIAEGDKKNVVESIKVSGLSHSYTIKGPSQYFWRAKYRQEDMESLYSDYSSFEAIDKVLEIKQPLMKSPPKNTRLIKDSIATFSWDEPWPQLEYLLEIFSAKDNKPIQSYIVKGHTKTHTFDQKSADYWWRVRAISRYGNQSLDLEKYKISVVRPEPKPEPPKLKPEPVPELKPNPNPNPARPASNAIKGKDYIQLKGREDLRGSEW